MTSIPKMPDDASFSDNFGLQWRSSHHDDDDKDEVHDDDSSSEDSEVEFNVPKRMIIEHTNTTEGRRPSSGDVTSQEDPSRKQPKSSSKKQKNRPRGLNFRRNFSRKGGGEGSSSSSSKEAYEDAVENEADLSHPDDDDHHHGVMNDHKGKLILSASTAESTPPSVASPSVDFFRRISSMADEDDPILSGRTPREGHRSRSGHDDCRLSPQTSPVSAQHMIEELASILTSPVSTPRRRERKNAPRARSNCEERSEGESFGNRRARDTVETTRRVSSSSKSKGNDSPHAASSDKFSKAANPQTTVAPNTHGGDNDKEHVTFFLDNKKEHILPDPEGTTSSLGTISQAINNDSKSGTENSSEILSPNDFIQRSTKETSDAVSAAVETRRRSPGLATARDETLHPSQCHANDSNDDEGGQSSVQPAKCDAPSGAVDKAPTASAKHMETSSEEIRNDPTNTLFVDLALSGEYSPSMHAPKYSESELQAKIDSALLLAEKEWMAKNKRVDDIKEEETKKGEDKEMEQRLEEQAERMRREHDDETKKIKDDMERKLREQKEEYEEKIKKERESIALDEGVDKKSSELQREREELLKRIELLEQQAKMDRTVYEKRIKEVRSEHTAEIDDMLAQLDLIEAEHNEKYGELERAVGQKDAIISALGAQLAEANAKIAKLDEEHANHLVALEASQQETIEARGVAQSLRDSMELMTTEHQKAIEEERAKGRVACGNVKKEMIAAAESQFAKANEHYKKLKMEYESTLDRLDEAEKELTSARTEAEVAKKERAALEVKMAAEVAQLKASLAAAEANAARAVQRYNLETESLQESERELRVKLDEANANCATAHMSLATLVAEKERLVRENAEINSVCEELMAMVEGGQTAQNQQQSG